MNAKIYDDWADVDALAAVPAINIKAANLKAGMVLIDPELNLPVAGIDHRIRAARGSGHVAYLVADLEQGGWREIALRPSKEVQVVAQ